jgi:hypothetical protein
VRSSVASKLRSGATFLGGDLVASRPWVTTQLAGYALASHTHTFASITDKPTTRSGYGITDAQPLNANLTTISGLSLGSYGQTLLTRETAAEVLDDIEALPKQGGTLTGLLSFSGTNHAGIRLINLTSAQVTALTGAAAGMVVFDTTLGRVRVHNGTSFTAGFVRLDGDTMTGSLILTTLETRNGGTATEVIVNNTRTDGSNFERGYARWASSVFRIGTERLGTGQARNVALQRDGTDQFVLQASYNYTSVPIAGGQIGSAPALSGEFGDSILSVGTNTASTARMVGFGNNARGGAIAGYQDGGGTVQFILQHKTAANTYSNRFIIDLNNSRLGIGNITPTAPLDISGDTIRTRTARTPANATATGNQGDFCWDSSFFYICTATNTWRRVAHATW